MRVFIAEYAVATGDEQFIEEGTAMLNTLVSSFARLGHAVGYPTDETSLPAGQPLLAHKDFFESLELAQDFDAGLVIAPDEVLAEATEILEKHTLNLGSSPDAVRLCADKMLCTRQLQHHNILAPATSIDGATRGRWVVKPRWGCGSEQTTLIDVANFEELPEGFIASEYVEGDSLSVSLVASRGRIMPITINRQIVLRQDNTFTYHGNQTPCEVDNEKEIMDIAVKAVRILGCRGYVGVDIINGDNPCIIDVNPRPTTSITPVNQILACEIAELIVNAKKDKLPEKTETAGVAELRVTRK